MMDDTSENLPNLLQTAVYEQTLRLYHEGRHEEILESIDAVIPDALSIPMLSVAASSAYILKHYTRTEAILRNILALNPTAETYNDLGVILKTLKRFDEALSVYRKAIEIAPKNATLFNNIANVFKELDAFKDAEAAYIQAITLNPAYANAHHNLGKLYKEFNLYEKAEYSYREALRYEPGSIEAQANLGYLLLSEGRFEEGWPLYETRYDLSLNPTFASPDVSAPRWQGESLKGKSILIVPEQGYGDEIQFVRYLPLLKRHSPSRIILMCKPPLHRLFSVLEAIDHIITSVEEAPAYDCWSYLLSLPMYLHTTLDTIPAQLPYLHLHDTWMDKRLGLNTHDYRVGVVWRGSSLHDNDANRSLPDLSSLSPLWSLRGVTYVSLQKELSDQETETLDTLGIINMGKNLRDFADTATVISQLDLIISVDTAVAHLSGAVGKECWVLLPAQGCDWRWMRDRNDSPWYPGIVRLFRQTIPREWKEPLTEIVEALSDHIALPIG